MRFMCPLVFAAVVTSALVAPALAQETPNMKPGQWELTIRNEMPGMPGAPQSFSTQHCYAAEDIKDAQRMLPKNPAEKNDCKFEQVKVTSSSMNYTMQCQTQAGKIVTKGSYSYKGETFEGQSQTEMPHPQGNGVMKMTTMIAAKRIGDCKAPATRDDNRKK